MPNGEPAIWLRESFVTGVTHNEDRAIFKKLGNLIWFLISWSLLLVAICVVLGGFYLYNRVDEEIRTHVESLLSQQYPHLNVSVRSARLLELEGFEIRGVSLAPNDASGVGQPILVAEEVMVRCNPQLDELLHGRVEVKEIIARRVAVRCSRQSEGGWTIQQIAKLPTLGGESLPTIRVENSTLEIVDVQPTSQRIYTLRDVNAILQPKDAAQAASDAAAQLNVRASASGDHLQRFAIHGAIVPKTGHCHFVGKDIRIDLSPALRDSLPVELGDHIGGLGSLVAKSEVGFNLRYDPNASTPLTYEVKGGLHNGRLEDPRLPYPLMDVTARFHCDHQTAVVNEIKARYGGATFDLTIEREGRGSNETTVAHGTVKNFTLREDLISRLSPEYQSHWKKFRPLGNCDAQFAVRRQDGRWSPSVEVTCNDVTLTWEKFRYPLRNTVGRVSIRDSEIGFDLTSRGTPQPVQIRGHIHQPGPAWRGWFEAHSRGFITIDETLIAAGSDKLQRIVRPFAARGNVSFATRCERTRGNIPVNKSAVIELADCTIQHTKFQYPLSGVSGRVEMTNDNWKFKNLSGRNDTARVQAEGTWEKNREGGWLSLYIICKDIPLDGELKNALPDGVQRTWLNLRPSGTLDHVAARYDFAPKANHSSVAVELKQWDRPQKDRDLTQTLSVTPKQFPYRIDNVTGTADYRDGQLELSGMRGNHGSVAFSTNGSAAVVDRGGWHLTLRDFHADRLQMDAELLRAAPARLSRAITRMGFQGATSLDGTIQLSSAGPNHPTDTRWNLAMDVEDGTLGGRNKLQHIAGAANLIGEATREAFVCRGNLAIDSMTTNGVQVANMTTPFWFDGNRVLLGSWAQPHGETAAPQPIQAQVFGGTLLADAQVVMDDLGTFETKLRMDNVNVATFARDMKVPVSRVTGLASAQLALRGTEQGRQTWRGEGAVQMQNTDLYELPIVLSLLKTLRTGSVNRSAFDEVAIDFRVQGEHTYLDRVDLRGDALTLKGAGELNRQRNVNLNFYTIMGRENAYIQAVRPLLGMASRRFMLVKVRGPLDQPAMTREMLPGINEALQEWFPETAIAGAAPPRGGSVERASYQSRPGAGPRFAR